ncbi:MAG: DUF5615 family PIN-like protein [Planctomycetota bacterium]|nr:DUF5615 family PIN-like protein [Planctomycetota bacterium]
MWLIDAQLPRRLAVRLNDLGENALHTLDLDEGNATTDTEICHADAGGRAVISKDRDFVDSFLVTGTPLQLLWVRTGNISNDVLLALFESLLPRIHDAFQQSSCVELTTEGLVLHE